MTDNYIVLNGERYDIITPKEIDCNNYATCKDCPIDGKCQGNIIDWLDDNLGIKCEEGCTVIKHSENELIQT
jgi:hypothetical protein